MESPGFADLDAFAAVARMRSFRGAAARRGVSASALSEAVRRLEVRLGVRLLNRTTRSVTPTDAGQRLLDRLLPVIGEIAAALDDVNDFRDKPRGTLRLNVPTVVARVILPPITARFLAAHPDIVLEVTADDRFIDVLAAGFDAGVRYDERLQKDMVAVPIGPRTQRFATAASPVYLDVRGRPRHPKDLMRHACIAHRFTSGVLLPWEFERGGRVVKLMPPGRVIANVTELGLEAAHAGLGVIHTFEEWLAPSIAAGGLEAILEPWWQRFPGPFLYYASRRHVPGPLRAFVDFLRR
jgi:DNA-binding transcriptional LysR family regulator